MSQLAFGKRVRAHRKARNMTLADLSELVGRPVSYLSQLENGKKDPRSSFVVALADALGCRVQDLNDDSQLDRRDELEVEIARIQEEEIYRRLRLPYFRPSVKVSTDVLEHVVTLYRALKETTDAANHLPGDAQRTANLELRQHMRSRNNYFPEIEAEAARVLSATNYEGAGPVSEGNLGEIAGYYGFEIARVRDLPRTARSVTDQRNRVIYIPQRDVLNSRGARSVVLQTLGHFVLGHRDSDDFGVYLRQRVESNYFAGAILAPEKPAVTFLRAAHERRDLSTADLREMFFLSYEMAAHRLTNLATEHLDLPLHFIRSDEEGVVWKAYENNDLPLPASPDGTVEGTRLCKQWGTRQAFEAEDGYDLHYQWTSTNQGSYWCVTFVESDRSPMHAITVGADEKHAKYFRGSDTTYSRHSTCPDPSCCTEPESQQHARWRGVAWPSAKDRSQVLSGLPAEQPEFSMFPGVDMVEVYDFLDRHVT